MQNGDVVINRFGNSEDPNIQSAFFHLHGNLMGAPGECSVSSDTKKLTDVLAFKAVNDFTNILGTPGTRKDTSSDVVDVLNGFRIEFHRLMFERRNESLESVAEPLDVPNPVIVIKLHH